jgi:putative aldouronate transport system permease protein
MAKPDLFKHIYVWSGIWQQTGYNAIIYIAALSGIDQQLYEAAKVDGCSRLQKIWHIDLPGIKSTIVILLILNMGYIMSVGFEKAYLMQNGLNLGASEIISTYIYRIGLINADFSFSTAIGLINSLINLVLILSFNKIARLTGESALW